MSDSEKVALIYKMISDFWEFHEQEAIAAGAETLVTAIYSVIEFQAEGE